MEPAAQLETNDRLTESIPEQVTLTGSQEQDYQIRSTRPAPALRTNTFWNDFLYLVHRLDIGKAKVFCPLLTGLVLDVGCGYRPYNRYLTNAAGYVGIEYDMNRHPDVSASAQDLPIRSSSVDSVMSNHVLEHLPEPKHALAEIARVLKPGGLLYLTVPQTWGLHYEPHDYYRYTKYGLEHMLSVAGFEVKTCEPMGGLFTHFVVRLFDIFASRWLFRVCDLVGLKRGRYRIAALLLLPAALVAMPVVSVLDKLEPTNVYAWAVLASKRA